MEISTSRPALTVVPRTPEQTAEQDGAKPVVREARALAPVRTESSQESANISGQAAADESQEQLEEAVESMQEAVKAIQRNLTFSIDDTTGRTVVEVKDIASGEVVRQLPSEEALKLAESLDEMRSLLFEAKA